MKRIIKLFLVLLVCFSIKTVYAENYKIKELIPYEATTTIHTDSFSYIGLYFDQEGIHFNSVKNLTDERMPLSVSIGLFNKDRINIGTINYCNLDLASKEQISYSIGFQDEYFGDKYNVKDVKYIAVLSDNTSCRTGGSTDYVGQNIKKLGVLNSEKLDSQTQLLLSILTVVAGALLVLIIYKLVFTRSYRNIDGKEVRDAFDDINKELAKKREEDEKNKTAPPKKEPDKPIEIVEQEEKAKNEDKSDTELHNLYK